MKKNILLLFAATLTAACAGNPPGWWNPSNAYSSDGYTRPAAAYSAPVSVHTPQPDEMPVPQEVDMAPVPDESYEEMILTPLQDEETENASGESSAQSAPSETSLLPPPSVLE